MQQFADTGVLRHMVSTFDPNDGVLRDYEQQGRWRRVVTFNSMLRHGAFPLAEAADFMLSAGQNEMRRPVEIEFAGNVFPTPGKDGLKGHIYWLQIRPIIDKKDMVDDDIIDVDDSRVILKSATALGHGNIDNVDTIVYVRPETFNSRNNGEVAEEIERINREFIAQGKNYVLMPGPLGFERPRARHTREMAPYLGGASHCRVVAVELPHRPQPRHSLFQNLTSMGVAYFTINPSIGDGVFDLDYLNSLPAQYESERVRIIRFAAPLPIAVNGKKRRGRGAKTPRK